MKETTYITDNIDDNFDSSSLNSYKKIYRVDKQSSVKKWTYAILLLAVVIMFLPWTQNIRAKGAVTTLKQEDRPQEVNTILAGRVIKWYVREGDMVKAGDTIMQLGEVKVDYFDTDLLKRTQQQLNAKKLAQQGYEGKAKTAEVQVGALTQVRELKLASLENKILQQRLKVTSDSNDVIAVTNELDIYKRQLDAGKLMYDSGVINLLELEKRRVNYQNGKAKKVSTENKFAQNKQELIALRIEQNSAVQEYLDKTSKAEGDRFGSLSNIATADAEIAKLENLFANYDIRNKLYYILAPQGGQIVKAKKAGIGEFMKEGEMIVEIVPKNIQRAVELFVDPMDLPLIGIGEKVRFIFDGFPVIVFSGWPQASYGTFGGVITAVETNISPNGKFRILVAEDPDTNEKRWPQNLKIGGGAQGIALLKDVMIGYELWRNINGFPPEYYKPNAKPKTTESEKK